MYLNPYTLLGYMTFAISTLMTVYALKGIDMKELVFIFPLSYIMVPLVASKLFKEALSRKQYIGILIIIMGTIIFNLDKLLKLGI